MLKSKSLLVILFLSICFSFSSCQNQKKSSPQSRTDSNQLWLEEFFTDLFLEESAIYTLWGTKPLTAFDICYYSEAELLELREQYPPPEGDESVIHSRYTLPENLKRWEALYAQYPMNNYLMFKIQDTEFPKIYRLFFVNVNSLVRTLRAHQKLFESRVGFGFDPKGEALAIEHSDSPFWSVVFNDGKLMGILYGYGLENSHQFCHNPVAPFQFSSSKEHFTKIDINHFPIPTFASFSEDDPMIQYYLNERDYIEKIYAKEAFVDLTLKRLISEE